MTILNYKYTPMVFIVWQLVVLVVFGAVDNHLHILENCLLLQMFSLVAQRKLLAF